MAEPHDLTLYREMWQALASRCEGGLADSALRALNAADIDGLRKAQGLREGFALVLKYMADIEVEAGVRPRGPHADDASNGADGTDTDEVITDA